MSHRLLRTDDAHWRRSNQMRVLGAPPEAANTAEMDAEQLRRLYPDGPRALPPELGGGRLDPETDEE